MAIDPKLIDDLNSRRKKVILSGCLLYTSCPEGKEKVISRPRNEEETTLPENGGGIRLFQQTSPSGKTIAQAEGTGTSTVWMRKERPLGTPSSKEIVRPARKRPFRPGTSGFRSASGPVSYTHLVVALAAGDQRGSPQTAAYGHCQVTVFFIGKGIYPRQPTDQNRLHTAVGQMAASEEISGAGRPMGRGYTRHA